jgi:DNA helicase-2/ATP-dependent DNA helicase PcrA
MSTVHAAKGLEWPVIFIPAGGCSYMWMCAVDVWCLLTNAVEQGTYPSYRCTEESEIAEERWVSSMEQTAVLIFVDACCMSQ